MAEALDVNTLKRRSRRRLVGAVALVLLAVIVLPMVFDTEPPQSEPPVSIRIPREDDTKFSPQLASPPPSAAPAAQTPPTPTPPPPAVKPPPAAKPAAPEASAKVAPAPPKAAAPDRPAAPKPEASATAARERAERARAEAALKNVEYVVPVIALANTDKVKALTARLAAAKMPYYTEPVATAQGPVTRVRVGPFANRAAAEKAIEKLKGMGLNPGKILEKS